VHGARRRSQIVGLTIPDLINAARDKGVDDNRNAATCDVVLYVYVCCRLFIFYD